LSGRCSGTPSTQPTCESPNEVVNGKCVPPCTDGATRDQNGDCIPPCQAPNVVDENGDCVPPPCTTVAIAADDDCTPCPTNDRASTEDDCSPCPTNDTVSTDDDCKTPDPCASDAAPVIKVAADAPCSESPSVSPSPMPPTGNHVSGMLGAAV